MSDYLAAEPATDPDAVFRNFMRHNLGRAAAQFDVTVAGEPVFGWRLRSIGAPAHGSAGARWLRVVSQEPQWACGESWTGTEDANAITGIAKPYVLDVAEWPERDWRNQRAELMTHLDGQPCSPTDVLRGDPPVTTGWWSALAGTLDTLSTVPTCRVHADQAKITQRITDRFGADAPTTVDRWETVHGDLHWSNLLRDPFGLLDWELWGQGPVGLDSATLYCFSLLHPGIAADIRRRFAYKLETPTGRVAQLYATARLLRRIDGGDFPDLAGPLRDHANGLLDG
ncbi:hypothetical protein GCM10009676_12890 [Prauserella halophila]|uniref:Aminoglycoside phosphotransferase domain-containing protein n=1 Tax=Prauserella halophila TaxID=185641 RepID=A0ABN1W3Q1_9PSEU|nr:phosphotransferase [Prauserella halophila]MCP2236493.1 hypothetical protein [Prauserella halophila]